MDSRKGIYATVGVALIASTSWVFMRAMREDQIAQSRFQQVQMAGGDVSDEAQASQQITARKPQYLQTIGSEFADDPSVAPLTFDTPGEDANADAITEFDGQSPRFSPSWNEPDQTVDEDVDSEEDAAGDGDRSQSMTPDQSQAAVETDSGNTLDDGNDSSQPGRRSLDQLAEIAQPPLFSEENGTSNPFYDESDPTRVRPEMQPENQGDLLADNRIDSEKAFDPARLPLELVPGGTMPDETLDESLLPGTIAGDEFPPAVPHMDAPHFETGGIVGLPEVHQPAIPSPLPSQIGGRDFDPQLLWWKNSVQQATFVEAESQQIGLDELLMTALQTSPRILAISQEPLIEEQEIAKSQAAFDPEAFMRTQFDNRNDPVGNTLTTGGAPFLQDRIWSGRTGLRKKLRTGASFEVDQELGFKNSNSQFFQPQDQGTATLSMSFSQPLLRGGGRMYNESRILLAQSFASTAWDRYRAELQDELLKVAEAYWQLYYFRSQLAQKRHNVQRGEAILAKLTARERLDSLPNQIARARAAVEARRSQLANAERDVRNAETQIRKLIAHPAWRDQYRLEMIPLDTPNYDHLELPVEQVVETAMQLRPEIKQALNRARSAAIQHDISRHELLPELNMLLGTYISGLEGQSGVFPAFGEQFGNTPGYYAGFEFNMPYRNREARSVYQQRLLNVKKIRHEMDEVLQDIVSDAQVNLRRLNSAHATLVSKISAIEAARADLEYQERRWEAFAIIEGDFAEGQNAAVSLDQLLEAQQRLTNEELAFARAELDFKVAQFYLKKAMGMLLQATGVQQ